MSVGVHQRQRPEGGGGRQRVRHPGSRCEPHAQDPARRADARLLRAGGPAAERGAGRRSAEIVAFKKENADALPTSLGFRQDRQAALQERLNQIQRELVLLDEQETRLNEVFASGGDIGGRRRAVAGCRSASRSSTPISNRHSRCCRRPTPGCACSRRRSTRSRDRILASAPGETEAVAAGKPAAGDARPAAGRDPDAPPAPDRPADLSSRRRSTPSPTSIAQDARGHGRHRQPRARLLPTCRRSTTRPRSGSATAATGERIELLSKGERISVIEHASVPTRPISPNRPLIAGAGAAAGIGSARR